MIAIEDVGAAQTHCQHGGQAQFHQNQFKRLIDKHHANRGSQSGLAPSAALLSSLMDRF